MKTTWLSLILAVAMLGVGHSAQSGEFLERAEAARYSFVVTEGDEPSRLATVLAEEYGFEPIELNAPTRKELDAAMESLYERVRPYDQLVVHIGLPVAHTDGTYFVPRDGDLESPWTLLDHRQLIDWLNGMPTGGAVVTYPACRAGESRDALLEELNYSKRPGPVEVLVACEYETARVKRRDPAATGGYLEWRGRVFANAIASALEEASRHADGEHLGRVALTTEELRDRISKRLESFDVRLLVVPYGEEPMFRFAHLGTTSEYRSRYENATKYGELSAVVQDYISAASYGDSGAAGLAELLRDIAVSPEAAAPAATLESQEALQLRSYAVDSLSRMSGEEARRALRDVATTTIDNGLIRRTAVSSLSKEPDSADLLVLRDAVQDEDPSVREAAVRGLGRARDAGAADLLATRLLTEPSVSVRVSMIQALSGFGRDGDRATFHELLDDRSAGIRKEAIAALARLAPDAETNRRLLDRLAKDPAVSVRETTASALVRAMHDDGRDDVVSGLIVALDASAPEEYRAAGIHLNDMEFGLFEPPSEHLSDGRPVPLIDLSAIAAASLGRVGGSDAQEALRLALVNPKRSDRVRVAAAAGLGQSKSVDVVPELTAAARPPSSPSLRRAAITALGEIGTSSARQVVYSALKDTDESVRREARKWVEALAIEPSTSELDKQIAALGSDDYGVRKRAIDELTRHQDPETVNRLIEALESPDSDVRRGAALVLGGVDSSDRRIVPALATATKDKNPSLRAAAVEALGGRGKDGGQFVLEASHDSDASVRLAAVAALRQLDVEEGRGRLEVLAKSDPSDRVRRAATDALSSVSYRRPTYKYRLKKGG